MATQSRMTARDLMSEGGVQCVGEHQSILDASRMMRDMAVGALPICGDDERLKGMITDRDIVVKCVAAGEDPSRITAGRFAGELYWIDAKADATRALETMERHRVKRLPVIDVDNGHRLCGMITEADLARSLTDQQVAEFASQVYAAA
ncbi:CBS domain-containing protein [Streptomyces sp. HPF1205]|uniref:CBS domain-containing protein n=1 Tax=Streptomyces sp. HPF1205 TaxID=2873262 RepID=UPI001CEC6F6F|nr:CBS domain-containing protein [Streptomyces sp. HPF1205]